MKLSKLYCNQPTFKNITFNLNGLNIIYANVIAKKEDKKNSHDLGKSKLIDLIDFMLLKEVKDIQDTFLTKKENKEKFIHHIFYLEILLNSGQYLTIKRSINEHKKICFALNNTTTNYEIPLNWQEFDDIKQAKQNLNNLLDMPFFSNKKYDYRKGLNNSFRKMPDDYQNVYKTSRVFHNRGKDKDFKPFIFDLLGFNGDLLDTKYKFDNEIKEINSNIKQIKTDFNIDEKQRDKYISKSDTLKVEYKAIEEKIDSFNFYEQDKKLIKSGIKDIEIKISELNSQSYILNYEIEKLNKSISNNFAFDINKVEKIFNETDIFFNEQLKHNYEELLKFNQQLTTQRNKTLKQALNIKNKELNDIIYINN